MTSHWPEDEALLQSSSLLSVRIDLLKRKDSLDIAREEYRHFIAQTYFFEALGCEIVSDLVRCAENPNEKAIFSSQLLDEIRHARTYSLFMQGIGACAPASCISQLRSRILQKSSFPEKVILGLVVLESLAIGLFSARATLYRKGPTYSLDLQSLAEESKHHGEAVEIICQMLRRQRLQIDSVIDIIRQGIRDITADLLPLEVAKKFSIGLSEGELKELRNAGIVGLQTAISRSALKKGVQSLKWTARSIIN